MEGRGRAWEDGEEWGKENDARERHARTHNITYYTPRGPLTVNSNEDWDQDVLIGIARGPEHTGGGGAAKRSHHTRGVQGTNSQRGPLTNNPNVALLL